MRNPVLHAAPIFLRRFLCISESESFPEPLCVNEQTRSSLQNSLMILMFVAARFFLAGTGPTGPTLHRKIGINKLEVSISKPTLEMIFSRKTIRLNNIRVWLN